MCGIFGLLSRTPRSGGIADIAATQKHRGPDAYGELAMDLANGWHLHVAHHRLAIIDVMNGGQPLRRGATTVVFNGEIYNFKSLVRTHLVQERDISSDTEALAELYNKMGVGLWRLLDGFWAFALMDQASGELHLVRDRFGIKPLYYAHSSSGDLIFSSELTPIMRALGGGAQISKRALSQYLFASGVAQDDSILSGVRKVPPGCELVWRDGQANVRRYFDPYELLSPQPPELWKDEEAWVRIESAVRSSMVSDVPMGVLLSGGLDSSLVAVAAADVVGEGLPTFAARIDEPGFDESSLARLVAHQIGSDHHEVLIRMSDIEGSWADALAELDEPLADPSLLPMRLLCQSVSQHLKTVLGGDGGDELFGGYPTYQAHRLRPALNLLPDSLMEWLGQKVTDLQDSTDTYQPIVWKLKRLLGRYDRNAFLGHARWMSGADLGEVQSLTGVPARPHLELGYGACLLREWSERSHDELTLAMLFDLTHYLPCEVLAKVDRASMRFGLEVRPPFLTHELVRWAYRVQGVKKVSFLETKRGLRRLARSRLPQEVCRAPKRGFSLPLVRWLRRGALRLHFERLIRSSPLWEGEVLSRESTKKIWSNFIDGRGDHSRTLWSIIVLDSWMRRHGIHGLVDDSIEEQHPLS